MIHTQGNKSSSLPKQPGMRTTPQQLAILRLLYAFRFLNRYQIQTLLKHKTFSRVNSWLAGLVKQGLISKVEFKEQDMNSKPVVYYLNLKSKEYLSSIEGFSSNILKRVYRERGRSQRFINHCIAVGNIYVHLQSLSNDKLIQFLVKEELTRTDHLITPPPDAYFAVSRTDKNIYRFFLEVFDPGMPRYAIRKRILDYFEFAGGQAWESDTGHEFPFVLLACPSDWVKNYLYRLIKAIEKDNGETICFYLTVYPQTGNNDSQFWQKVN